MTVNELVEQFEKAAAEWAAAARGYEAALEAKDWEAATVGRAGMRHSRADTAWHVLCRPDNVLLLCAALKERL